jgi:hypothetical protein
MRVLRPIVHALVLAMLHGKAHLRPCSAVGTELVRDHDAGRRGCRLQELCHEPLRRAAVSAALDQDVEDKAILIDGAPEPMLLARDRDEEVSGAGEFRPRALSEPDVILSHHPAPIVQPLLYGFALSMRVFPSPVALSPEMNNATPSLQSHYRTFITTTGCSAPVPCIGTLTLIGSAYLDFSLNIRATGSRVPHRSLDQSHAAFMPDAAWAEIRPSPRLVPG